MSKKLLIVESPSKIKTISKFLGKDYRIMATMGHIMDLPTKELGVTINGSINIDYVPIENKDKTIAEICKEASKCNEIYLAPDPDREGEIIAWHVKENVKKVADQDKIYRVSFNEITKDAVENALSHPSHINMEKVAAQQARRVLDRWVGYEVSPVLWRKIAKGLSAGRVQSVALKLICDREKEILEFKAEEYWSITGTFANKNKSSFIAQLDKINKKAFKISNEKKAKEVSEDIKKTDFEVKSITDKERIKKPYPPFMTSTLQQAAYNQLGFSVKKTMQIAQKLYEGVELNEKGNPIALITYMRTDSLRIADSALPKVRNFIKNNFDKNYLPSKANVYEKKTKAKTQDAHEAIRPVDVDITPEFVQRFADKDLARLYDLIWKRFVSCQMTPAKYAQRQVLVEGGKYTFKVTGSTLIFDGFLKLYKDEEDDKDNKTIQIPADLEANQSLIIKKIDPKQHFTQAPPRYTEASLVKTLEKEGIGRPSTYASILNTIRARSYTELDTKKRFIPTELGMAVTKMLTENLPKIMDVKFTANMEEELDQIEKGDLERDKLLREFWNDFSKDLEEFKGKKGKAAQETEIICPECKEKKLLIRFGKSGEFLGCPGFPECKFTSNFTKTEEGKLQLVEQAPVEVLEETCPECKKNKLREVVGKFGKFIACSGYPECKHIKQEKAGHKCPECKKGDLVKRTWRKGSFWGCSNYPKCKGAIFGEIVEQKCSECDSPIMTKRIVKKEEIIECPKKASHKK